MHALVAIVGLLTSAAFIAFVGRVLFIGAGFAVLNAVGLEVLLAQLEGFVRSYVGALPATMLSWLGMLNVDLYLNWLFLGLSIRISILGLYRLTSVGNT